MDLFNSKNKQALITAQNRAAMYNPSRPSECNTDGTAFKKSSDDLDLIKGGEGSKGGKVIGHTKSGKPIYEHFNHAEHKGFSADDHHEAGMHHLKAFRKDKEQSHIDHAQKHFDKQVSMLKD